MSTQIQLLPRQLAELQVLRDLLPEDVGALVEEIERRDPSPLTSAELGSVVNEFFDDDFEVANILLGQVLSLANLERQRNLSAAEILDGLLYGIQSSGRPWNKEEVAKWDKLNPELCRLLEHPKVWRVAKALDLASDFANLLQEAKIVADIRPVFDRDATRLEAAVVCLTLRLRYDNIHGNHDLSIAMNQSDVESLLEECQRSLRKAQITVDIMTNQAHIQTMITGGDALPKGENDANR